MSKGTRYNVKELSFQSILTLLNQFPADSKLVTDVGSSLISGFGDLVEIVLYNDHTVELVFG